LWARGRYLLLIQEENRSEGLLGAKNKAKKRIYPKISALNEYKIHFASELNEYKIHFAFELNEYKIHFAFDIDSAIESHF
jgi:hypothetical protein